MIDSQQSQGVLQLVINRTVKKNAYSKVCAGI